jgi:dTDP-4-amino-4,6-dideoxygalactose transaminase
MLNLQRQYAQVGSQIEAAVSQVLREGQYILGPAVERFESVLAQQCGVRYAVALSSGTDALLLALMALKVRPGDEVIVPAFSFFASASVIARIGAVPVFVDIDPTSYLLEPKTVAAAVTAKTAAVIPVHLYGQMCDIEALSSLGLPLVEDAAQAIGAERNGLRPGVVGALAALSFYPTKNLGGAGDAGALLTNDETLARECRALRVHGQYGQHDHRLLGGNFRMDAIQAAVLSVKLQYLPQWTSRRRELAGRYQRGLGPGVAKPVVLDGLRHVFHQYVIAHPRRDALAAHLATAGIDTAVHYPKPIPRQPCFCELPEGKASFPGAERAAAQVLALPIYPELRDDEQDYVIDQVNAFSG